jgi:hypothetical protein
MRKDIPKCSYVESQRTVEVGRMRRLIYKRPSIRTGFKANKSSHRKKQKPLLVSLPGTFYVTGNKKHVSIDCSV